MARGMNCVVCGQDADYISYVPRGAHGMSVSDFITVGIWDVDPEAVLWSWEGGAYDRKYVGQCSLYFCEKCVRDKDSAIERESQKQFR